MAFITWFTKPKKSSPTGGNPRYGNSFFDSSYQKSSTFKLNPGPTGKGQRISLNLNKGKGKKISKSKKPASKPMTQVEYKLENMSKAGKRIATKLGVSTWNAWRRRPRKGKPSEKRIGPSPSGGLTFSRFRGRFRSKRKFHYAALKETAKQTITNQTGLSWTSSQTGYQLVKSPNYTGYDLRASIFNLVCNKSTGVSIATADYNKKMYLYKAWSRYTLTNYDFSTCLVDIYVMRPRTNCNDSPLAILTANLGTPGAGSDEATGGATNAYTYPFVSPYVCRSLLQSYKIVSKKRIELLSGCSHQFLMTLPWNQTTTGWELASQGNAFNPAFDRVPLFVVNGTPVHDSLAPATVSSSKIKLDVVVTWGGQGAILGYQVQQNLNLAGSLANIASEQTSSSNSLVTD